MIDVNKQITSQPSLNCRRRDEKGKRSSPFCKMWYLYLWWARCADNDNTLLEASGLDTSTSSTCPITSLRKAQGSSVKVSASGGRGQGPRLIILRHKSKNGDETSPARLLVLVFFVNHLRAAASQAALPLFYSQRRHYLPSC